MTSYHPAMPSGHSLEYRSVKSTGGTRYSTAAPPPLLKCNFLSLKTLESSIYIANWGFQPLKSLRNQIIVPATLPLPASGSLATR